MVAWSGRSDNSTSRSYPGQSGTATVGRLLSFRQLSDSYFLNDRVRSVTCRMTHPECRLLTLPATGITGQEQTSTTIMAPREPFTMTVMNSRPRRALVHGYLVAICSRQNHRNSTPKTTTRCCFQGLTFDSLLLSLTTSTSGMVAT